MKTFECRGFKGFLTLLTFLAFLLALAGCAWNQEENREEDRSKRDPPDAAFPSLLIVLVQQ